jgi:tetratricopeptide (TPR) repeat protein
LIMQADVARIKFDKAFDLLEQAANVSRQVGDGDGYAHALQATARLHWLNNDRVAARKPAEEALAIYRANGNAEGIARAATSLGIVLGEEGDVDAARKLLTEALAVRRKIRSKVRTADSLLNLGFFLAETGELAKGRGMEVEAAGIYRQFGSGGEQMAMGNVAQIFYWEGNLAGMEEVSKQTIKISRANKSRGPSVHEGVIASLQAVLGEARLSQDNFPEAKRYLEESRAFDVKYPSQGKDEATCDLDLARLAFEESRFSDGEKLARNAADKFRKGGLLEWTNYAETYVALSLLPQGKTEEAFDILESSRPLAIKQMDIRLPFLIAAARAYALHNDRSSASELQQAKQWLTTALNEATKYGYTEFQLDARLARGEIAVRTGNISDGLQQLATLENEARAKGFLLVARKAAAASKLRAI